MTDRQALVQFLDAYIEHLTVRQPGVLLDCALHLRYVVRYAGQTYGSPEDAPAIQILREVNGDDVHRHVTITVPELGRGVRLNRFDLERIVEEVERDLLDRVVTSLAVYRGSLTNATLGIDHGPIAVAVELAGELTDPRDASAPDPTTEPRQPP